MISDDGFLQRQKGKRGLKQSQVQYIFQLVITVCALAHPVHKIGILSSLRRNCSIPSLALGSALTLISFLGVGSAEAKLVGADRDEFVANFTRGCYQSIESREVITAHGGGPNELKRYCSCVSSIYADNLNVETIRQLGERRRRQIADVSREVCLKKIFSSSR